MVLSTNNSNGMITFYCSVCFICYAESWQ